MNLSPDWIPVLREAGLEVVHWSNIGDPGAPDKEIMTWAKDNHCVVFTHDLDFGSLLALTQAEGPSVIQIRTQDVTPAAIGPLVLRMFHQFHSEIEAGALIVLDEARSRARILPLRRRED